MNRSETDTFMENGKQKWNAR
ncbi:hypothetical protein VULLAG_LOCUS4133 [Vulpes lagopus]